MLFATISQPLIFLWMMVCGCAAALWYGMMALVRRLIGAGFWLSLICDLIFGLGCAVILIGALVAADWGRMRFYSIAGALTGAILTGFGLISPLRDILSHLCAFLQELWRRIAKYRLIKVIFK